jgi:deferrochelatase/peroxidase EfeB
MTRPASPSHAGNVEYQDIQGIVRFGFGKMTEASYTLARIRHAGAARQWLSRAPITSAVTLDPPPTTAVQVAFTAAGLDALGVPASVVAGFSPEFLAGMTEDNRARRLGDVGDSAPSHWEWGGAGREPHVLVIAFAESAGLPALTRQLTQGPWSEAFEVMRVLGTAHLDGVEPFGFADGLSQPRIDWSGERDVSGNTTSYSNIVALGEFLLGYRNEYDKYTDRPLLDVTGATTGLPNAEDVPGKKDLGRNGTYLVMRQLSQDVRAFWQFIKNTAGSDPDDAEALAAAFVGRKRSGEPLMAIQDEAIPGIGPGDDEVGLNQFTFDRDPTGISCPIGAHVRRANPRNADLTGNPRGLKRLLAMIGIGRRTFEYDLTSSVRFHRVLRRGREYGSGLSPADAVHPAPPDEPERGLHFVCLNANIARQFEFLQNAWMASAKFSGLNNERDPLIGNRQPAGGCPATSTFVTPKDGALGHRVSGLPQFVTVRGGAYFFLPGLRALKYISGA